MKLFEALLLDNFNLSVDEELSFDDNKLNATNNFLKFCCNELSIDKFFSCKIVSDRNKNGIKTTAYYDRNNELVVVYGKNRMLGDILRSVAHELVHHLQFLDGRIDGSVQDLGGEIEDEANAKAGYLVKKFINYHPLGESIFEEKIVIKNLLH